MPWTVPGKLQSNEPVSDADLAEAVHYYIRTMQYYVKQPKSPLVNPTKQHRLIDEGYLVLNAAERRGLQRTLELNTLGRMRALLERILQQMQSRGVAYVSPSNANLRA